MWRLLPYALIMISLSSRTMAAPANHPVLPDKFGLGKAAGEAEVIALDIDVRPDGAGLPEGSGTVANGEKIYQNQCQSCHGLSGKGGVNEPLAGRLPNDAFPFASDKPPKKTIGNYWPYATTLFDYIRRTMPYTQPGSLTDPEVYSVTAYLLYINDIIDRSTTLSKENLPKVTMPSRQRFRNDDRLQFKKAH